jgi:flagellar motor component MotA
MPHSSERALTGAVEQNRAKREGHFMKRILAAAVLAAAIFGIKRWMDQRYPRIAQRHRNPTESWENEGGALQADPAQFETPQAAR